MFEQGIPTESRWVSVVFLQAERADRVIGTITRLGPVAGIEYLRQWDRGDETTDAALTNGYVYDRIPAGLTDRTLVQPDSPYALTYNAVHRYVSLLRRYPTEPVPSCASSSNRPSRIVRPVIDIWGPVRDRPAAQGKHAVAM